MKDFNERLTDVSLHLQTLTAPEFCSEVQDAVEKNDRSLLMEICKKAKIPTQYLSTVVSVVFSVGPNVKWPDFV